MVIIFTNNPLHEFRDWTLTIATHALRVQFPYRLDGFSPQMHGHLAPEWKARDRSAARGTRVEHQLPSKHLSL